MASNIPAALKSADIGRYAVRAAQLEKAKPIIAYWCNYWIANQIIEKGLHTTDDEVKLYTVDLMEKLEQFKVENPDNDAILDSMAASAYVEQFALEVFGRAEAAMRADKVTKQTADTFQAAATFLELCQIWNPLELEAAAKVKFAKYHAVRIVKAIKAGEDPNATNPKIEEEAEDLPLVQEIEPAAEPSTQAPLQPTVEDVPDESQNTLPSRTQPTLPHIPSTFPESGPFAQGAASTPSFEHDSPLNLPSAPDTFASSSAAPPALPDAPTSIGAHHRHAPSNEFQSFPPPSAIPPPGAPTSSHDVSSFYNTPSAFDPARFGPTTGHARTASYSTQNSLPATPSAPVAAAPPPSAQTNPQNIDDQAISQAQKHARWAVSALSFDDVDTAIKELRNSLKLLGAE
ncbi:Vta1 like-domain-containing protein [Aspergillus pseudoustus]|uniref:Vta1 like-domain-containing protein n=1 Tax=Aspergillus pseudoustus TaxID=1810923 RepID=A0ABR4KA66_9EURO